MRAVARERACASGGSLVIFGLRAPRMSWGGDGVAARYGRCWPHWGRGRLGLRRRFPRCGLPRACVSEARQLERSASVDECRLLLTHCWLVGSLARTLD